MHLTPSRAKRQAGAAVVSFRQRRAELLDIPLHTRERRKPRPGIAVTHQAEQYPGAGRRLEPRILTERCRQRRQHRLVAEVRAAVGRDRFGGCVLLVGEQLHEIGRPQVLIGGVVSIVVCKRLP